MKTGVLTEFQTPEVSLLTPEDRFGTLGEFFQTLEIGFPTHENHFLTPEVSFQI